MNLRETTRDIIGQVEAQTGFPVQVLDDRTLPTVRLAREGVPAHIVRYCPSDTQPPDYMICYQCGFILRLFANPPEERFEVGSSPQGQQAAAELMSAHLGPRGLSPQQLAPLVDQIYNGLIVHLRSVPVGLRVSAWLTDDYPELGQLQRRNVDAELQINGQSLSPQMQAMFPEPIYRATLAISGAYAHYWSRHHQQRRLARP